MKTTVAIEKADVRTVHKRYSFTQLNTLDDLINIEPLNNPTCQAAEPIEIQNLQEFPASPRKPAPMLLKLIVGRMLPTSGL